jgi:hypothetical protein
MSLSYISDLAAAFNNISQIDDYTSIPKYRECLDERINNNLPFNFGVYTMNITLKQINKHEVGYIIKDDIEPEVTIDYCKTCLELDDKFITLCHCPKVNYCKTCLELDDKFVTDCDCLKPKLIDRFENQCYLSRLYIPNKFHLYFGFYCDTPIEFDIFVMGHHPYHYILEPGKFTPFYTIKDNNIVLVSYNAVIQGREWEIRNIKSDIKQFNLHFLGTNLNYDLRKETMDKCMTNFRLFPK